MPDMVMERLMDWIMDGRLHMGQKLVTEDLAKELGVSRMPVREAIKNLEKLGIAESAPYCGSRLTVLTRSDIHQIYTMRKALEPILGYYACLNSSSDQIAEAVRIQDSFEEQMRSGDLTAREIFSRNRDFHFAIYRSAAMDRVFHTVAMLWNNLAFCKMIFGQTYITSSRAAGRMMTEHRDYLGALAGREAERLRGLMLENLSRIETEMPEKLAAYLNAGQGD